MLIWQYIPALLPICIRPLVVQADTSNENNLTVKLRDIMWYCVDKWASEIKDSAIHTLMARSP